MIDKFPFPNIGNNPFYANEFHIGAMLPTTSSQNTSDDIIYKNIGLTDEEIIDQNKKKEKQLEEMISESSVAIIRNKTFFSPEQLLQWMKENMKYNSEDRLWKLQSCERTLDSKFGNCHDQALLEYWVFEKLGLKPKSLFMIEYKGDKIYDAGSTHTITYYVKNNRLWWFENAWASQAGIHGPYKDIVALQDDIASKWEWGKDYDRLFIGPCNYRYPAMNLNDYASRNVPMTGIPMKYYSKELSKWIYKE